MRAQFISLSIILVINSYLAYSQKSESSRLSVKNISVIVMKLSGNCIIESNLNDSIIISSFLKSSGNVWGWVSDSENFWGKLYWGDFAQESNYKISFKASNDTLFLWLPEIPNIRGSIGLVTYSGTTETKIKLPVTKKLIIKKAFKVFIEDEFESIEVSDANKLVVYNINKSGIKLLKCSSFSEINIDGNIYYKKYEFKGNGTKKYKLNAHQIDVRFN